MPKAIHTFMRLQSAFIKQLRPAKLLLLTVYEHPTTRDLRNCALNSSVKYLTVRYCVCKAISTFISEIKFRSC